ncbi:hypothetical protein VPH35_006344 [Triticum aestivum]
MKMFPTTFVWWAATTTLIFMETMHAYEAEITTGFHPDVHMMAGHSTGHWARLRGPSRLSTGGSTWMQLLRKEALRGQEVLGATSDPSDVVGSAKKFHAGVKALIVLQLDVAMDVDGAVVPAWCAHYMD